MLGVIGILVGLFLGILTKRRTPTPSQPAIQTDAETMRRLTQLKNQLDSGLITQDEYQQERDILLRE